MLITLQPDTRMSQFRGKLRVVVNSEINAAYGLVHGAADFEQRLQALFEHRRYLYPGDPISVCAFSLQRSATDLYL